LLLIVRVTIVVVVVIVWVALTPLLYPGCLPYKVVRILFPIEAFVLSITSLTVVAVCPVATFTIPMALVYDSVFSAFVCVTQGTIKKLVRQYPKPGN
jgi:hypothetical protein